MNKPLYGTMEIKCYLPSKLRETNTSCTYSDCCRRSVVLKSVVYVCSSSVFLLNSLCVSECYFTVEFSRLNTSSNK